MAKFSNSPPKGNRPTSAIQSSAAPTGSTYNGGAGYSRSPEGEAFLLASGGFLGGEKTFYEGGSERDDRFRALIRELSVTNPDWVASFLFWLRREGNIRTASIIGAAEYVWARRDEMGTGRTGTVYPTPSKSTRDVVSHVIIRPDEPQEIIGYWLARYGRSIPKPLKRGVADAVQRHYTQKSVLKYDSDKRAVRMGDVLNLVHADPTDAKQSLIFEYIMARRFGRVDRLDFKALTTISAHEEMMRIPVGQRRAYLELTLDDGDVSNLLDASGMTWEMLAGWLQGPMDKEAWQAVIPNMGYMALLRNLRNFIQAGVRPEVMEEVAARISDPNQVSNSKQFPFRFWAAYKANYNAVIWSYPLEKALNLSMGNVPSLSGNTLILVDRSGSMFQAKSDRSELTFADSASLFGAALALRAEKADLIQFGTGHLPIPFQKSDSLVRIMDRFSSMGGTNTIQAIRDNLRADHDRVIVITDEQCTPGYISGGWSVSREVEVNDVVRPHIPFYMWNFAGYKMGMAPSGSENRHTLGGLTDSSFRMIPLIESGANGTWPWDNRG